MTSTQTHAPGTVVGADVPVRVVVWRGLPGSGKTTQAKARLAQLRKAGVRAGQVSRDAMRAALGLVAGDTTDTEEEEVRQAQHDLIRALVSRGVTTVLIDDTHLDDERLGQSLALAAELGAGVEVVDLRHVPLEVCIARDAARAGNARVGVDRIREMATDAGLLSPVEGALR